MCYVPKTAYLSCCQFYFEEGVFKTRNSKRNTFDESVPVCKVDLNTHCMYSLTVQLNEFHKALNSNSLELT